MTMNPPALLDLMRTRRSLRLYTDDAVPEACIGQIMEAATWAPSAHNRQPWRFVLIKDSASKIDLARQMGARLRQDLTRDDVPPAVIEADVSRSYQRITAAPLLILLCMSLRDMDVYTDERRNCHERTMAQQSTAMAGQNMLLMADSLGLGACWMCAPLFCQELVAQVLDLPEGWLPQGMITLGFPAQTRERRREAWSTRALWR